MEEIKSQGPAQQDVGGGATILRAVDISKRFLGIRALDRVSFDLHRGEVHGLIGENGAGKSTLMKILSGNYEPDEGTILIDGKVERFYRPYDAKRRGILLIHQEISLAQNLTVAENLFLGGMPTRMGGAIDWKRLKNDAEKVLRRFECAASPDAIVSTLPSAQQQLIEICRSETFGARVVILDEPTASLTRHEAAVLFRNIDRLRKEGCSLIYISHKLDEILSFTDRVTVLRDGQKRNTFETSLTNVDELTQAMIGRQMPASSRVERVARESVALEVRDAVVAGTDAEVSLHLSRGEVLGLYGLVGAGRSELAEAIFGVRPLKAGRIFVDGQEVTIARPRDAISHGIALAPEDRKRQGLVLVSSVLSNMVLPTQSNYVRGFFVSKALEQAVFRRYRGELKIAAANDEQSVGLLSGGNQQKVVLAKWLNARPKILILDEPTRGVDIGAKNEIYRIILELAGLGVSIVLISSEMAEIIALSGRVLTMYRRQFTGEWAGSDITEDNLVRGATSASHASRILNGNRPRSV